MNIEKLKEALKKQIAKTIKEMFGIKPDNVVLDFPPDVKFGDFALVALF